MVRRQVRSHDAADHNKGMKMELDETLAILRKHNVIDFSQDQFGLRVKFAPLVGLRFPMPYDEPIATNDTHEASPVVDAQQLNIDDVLYGAK